MSEYIKISFNMACDYSEVKNTSLMNGLIAIFNEQSGELINEGLDFKKSSGLWIVYFEHYGLEIEDKIKNSLNYLAREGATGSVLECELDYEGGKQFFALKGVALIAADSKRELDELLKDEDRFEDEFYESVNEIDSVLIKMKIKKKAIRDKLESIFRKIEMEDLEEKITSIASLANVFDSIDGNMKIQFPSFVGWDGGFYKGPENFIETLSFVRSNKQFLYLGFAMKNADEMVTNGLGNTMCILSEVCSKFWAKVRFSDIKKEEIYYFLLEGDLIDFEKEKQENSFWPR